MSAYSSKSSSSSSSSGARSGATWGGKSVAERNAALSKAPSGPSSSSSSGPSSKRSVAPSSRSNSAPKSSNSAQVTVPYVKLETSVYDRLEYGSFIDDLHKYSEMSDEITNSTTVPSGHAIQIRDVKCKGGLALTEPELLAVGIWIVKQLEEHYGVKIANGPENVFANIPTTRTGEVFRHGQIHFRDPRVIELLTKATMGEKKEVEVEEAESSEYKSVPESSASAWDVSEPVTSWADYWADVCDTGKRYKTVFVEPWFPMITFVFPQNRVAAARAAYMKDQGLGPQDMEDVEQDIPEKLNLVMGKSFSIIKPDAEGNVYDPYTLSSLFRTKYDNLPASFYIKLLDAIHDHFARYNTSKTMYHPEATKNSKGAKVYHDPIPLYPLCSISNNGRTVFVNFGSGLSDATDACRVSKVMRFSIPNETSEGTVNVEGILVFNHALLNERKDEHEKIPHVYKYKSGFTFLGGGKKKTERKEDGKREDRRESRKDGNPAPRSRKFDSESETNWRKLSTTPKSGPSKGGYNGRSNGFGGLSEE